MSDLCPIWRTQAEIEPTTGDFSIVNSPRAGGRYWISGTDIALCAILSNQEKAFLTSELIEQRMAGVELPKIGSDTIALSKKRKSLAYSQKVDRFFKWLNFSKFQPGEEIRIKGLDAETDLAEGKAWIEADTDVQIEKYIEILINDGYFSTENGYTIQLTSKGCERLEKLAGINGESTQAFVAMWFNPEIELAYSNGIKEAIIASGYDPMRIDKKEHSNKIDDEIIAEIRRSRFVIADFTSGYVSEGDQKTLIARGGVYYEAGFAQGLGVPVIWTCREDCLKHIHFDTRQYAHIVWTTAEDLREKLTKRIGAIIGWGPNAKV
jgi:hypothetical protein